MYYEIYLDSLLLLQFCLNLYLLALVNRFLYHTASIRRILGGAVLGAVCSVLPFLLPIKLGYSMLSGFLLSTICMSFFTFRIRSWEQFLNILEKMLVMTLLLGVVLLFWLKLLHGNKGTILGVFGVLALGAVSYGLVCKLTKTGRMEESVCKVFLAQNGCVLQLEALIDTGNSLTEPISKEPVAVLEKNSFQELFGENIPQLYRVIPYHSIGKSSGILKGYQVESMIIEVQGTKKECGKVYVAVSEQLLSEKSNYQIILNPRMLESKVRK